jgi:hypothetical protein
MTARTEFHSKSLLSAEPDPWESERPLTGGLVRKLLARLAQW